MIKEKDMSYNYTLYEQIPSTITSYMLTVADADNISQIPLSDINSFLNGLEDQMNQQDYYNSVEDM